MEKICWLYLYYLPMVPIAWYTFVVSLLQGYQAKPHVIFYGWIGASFTVWSVVGYIFCGKFYFATKKDDLMILVVADTSHLFSCLTNEIQRPGREWITAKLLWRQWITDFNLRRTSILKVFFLALHAQSQPKWNVQKLFQYRNRQRGTIVSESFCLDWSTDTMQGGHFI